MFQLAAMSGMPNWRKIKGATCVQLAMKAVPLYASQDANPKPEFVKELKMRTESIGVSGVRSHSPQKSKVICSRCLAVSESRPTIRTVNVESLAPAVLQNACAMCVLRRLWRSCFRRQAAATRLLRSLCISGGVSCKKCSLVIKFVWSCRDGFRSCVENDGALGSG